MRTWLSLIVPALLLAGCTGSTSEQDAASIETKAIEHVDGTVETPPALEGEARLQDLEERRDTSRFKGMEATSLEGQLKSWITEFRSTCDTTIYRKCKDALSKDVHYQEWRNEHREAFLELWEQMRSAKDSCNRSMAGNGVQ